VGKKSSGKKRAIKRRLELKGLGVVLFLIVLGLLIGYWNALKSEELFSLRKPGASGFTTILLVRIASSRGFLLKKRNLSTGE